MIQLNKLNLKSKLCTSYIKITSLNCITIMKMMIIFTLFYNFVLKDKSIHFLKKKEGLMRKQLLNTLENVFQQCSIYILLIHRLFIEILSLKIFYLIRMEWSNQLILGGVIIMRMRIIKDLLIVVRQSILLLR